MFWNLDNYVVDSIVAALGILLLGVRCIWLHRME